MKVRGTVRTIGFAVALLAVGRPALADQAAVNKCALTIAIQNQKIISLFTKLYQKCVAGGAKCFVKPVAQQAQCLADLQAAGKPCSAQVLNASLPGSQEAKALAVEEAKIAAACGNPPLALTDLLDVDLNNPFGKVGFGVARNAMCGPIANLAGVLACIRFLAIKQAAMALVWDVDPRAAALARLLLLSFVNPIPLGTHKVAAAVDINITHAAGALNVAAIPFQFFLDLGAPALTGEIAVGVPGTSIVVPPQPNAGGSGYTMCVKPVADGFGRLCCAAGGCAALNKKDFDVLIDHDSSGNNPGFVANEVGPADPTCSTRKVNTVSNIPPFTNLPCLEGEARPNACNAFLIGQANPKSHHPRCTGGDRVGRACDPALAATDCPGGGGGVCKSISATEGILPAPPCIGPYNFQNGANGFDNGDMIVAMFLQYTFHNEALDAVNFGGGCANVAGDGKPDGYGCDGVACTTDDTTPPDPPVTYVMTTGTTRAKVFDANMKKTANGGLLDTNAVTGVVPANACQSLALSVTAGYQLQGASPAVDEPNLGDTVTVIEQNW